MRPKPTWKTYQSRTSGETVFIAQDKEHKVQLIPITHTKRNRVAGSGKGTFTMSDDFDAPLPDFAEYMQ